MVALRKEVREELDSITSHLVNLSREMKEIESLVKQLKARYLDLAERHVDMDSRSRIWPVDSLGMRARATYPEASPPSVDYDKLMRIIGSEVFAGIFTVKNAEMDLDAWNEAVKNEEVRDQHLMDCLGDQRDPPRPSVLVEAIPKNGGDK